MSLFSVEGLGGSDRPGQDETNGWGELAKLIEDEALGDPERFSGQGIDPNIEVSTPDDPEQDLEV